MSGWEGLSFCGFYLYFALLDVMKHSMQIKLNWLIDLIKKMEFIIKVVLRSSTFSMQLIIVFYEQFQILFRLV